MTNLAILFTGNVGSTPLIQLARQHPRVLVPIQEQFDEQMIARDFPDTKPMATPTDALDHLYRRKMSPFFERPVVERSVGQRRFPRREIVPHTLFNWRSAKFEWGVPGCTGLREVLRRNRVRALVLARRSVVEQAAKIHMSEVTYGGRQQQFKAARMSDAEYAAYLEAQNTLRIEIDGNGLQACRTLARQFLKRTEQIISAARDYFDPEVPPQLLISEQVLRPEIDLSVWSKVLSLCLDDDIALTPQLQPRVRKAGLGLENCANPEIVAQDRILRRLEKRYQKALRALPPILGRHRPRGIADLVPSALYAPPLSFDRPALV